MNVSAAQPCTSSDTQALTPSCVRSLPFGSSRASRFTLSPRPPIRSARSDPVAVFWDIENCSVPKGVNGSQVAEQIRCIAMQFGSLQQFSAFGNLGRFRPETRTELTNSGVQMIDIVSGKKNAADKAIVVEMFCFALDHVPTWTTDEEGTPVEMRPKLVLITGDVDFSIALSKLRHRHYEVIVIAPLNHSDTLRHCADHFLLWDDLLVRDLPSYFSTSAPSSRTASSCSSATAPASSSSSTDQTSASASTSLLAPAPQSAARPISGVAIGLSKKQKKRRSSSSCSGAEAPIEQAESASSTAVSSAQPPPVAAAMPTDARGTAPSLGATSAIGRDPSPSEPDAQTLTLADLSRAVQFCREAELLPMLGIVRTVLREHANATGFETLGADEEPGSSSRRRNEEREAERLFMKQWQAVEREARESTDFVFGEQGGERCVYLASSGFFSGFNPFGEVTRLRELLEEHCDADRRALFDRCLHVLCGTMVGGTFQLAEVVHQRMLSAATAASVRSVSFGLVWALIHLAMCEGRVHKLGSGVVVLRSPNTQEQAQERHPQHTSSAASTPAEQTSALNTRQTDGSPQLQLMDGAHGAATPLSGGKAKRPPSPRKSGSSTHAAALLFDQKSSIPSTDQSPAATMSPIDRLVAKYLGASPSLRATPNLTSEITTDADESSCSTTASSSAHHTGTLNNKSATSTRSNSSSSSQTQLSLASLTQQNENTTTRGTGDRLAVLENSSLAPVSAGFLRKLQERRLARMNAS